MRRMMMPCWRNAILDGIDNANRALRELGTGTSTTLVVAEIREQQVRTFHIGDSSAWLCGQRGLVKLQTTPHSPLGFALEAGFVDEKEALHHEDLNLISNVVGSADMRIEIGSRVPLAPKDTLLIASDGLFDNVLEGEIVRSSAPAAWRTICSNLGTDRQAHGRCAQKQAQQTGRFQRHPAAPRQPTALQAAVSLKITPAPHL